jgi:tRNA(fMet)-specific endonuclease VapC
MADLRETNQVIGHNDVLIGATALEHDMVLVTNNTQHFSRIPGLSLDNWTL